MRGQIVALAALLCAAPAAAQGLTHFYCYAPDAATDTVYMSQALPVGPVGERGGYGREFVAYLMRKGVLSKPVQAYCTMRTSSADIDRSRHALAEEGCAECGAASHFEDVTWPRGGAPSQGASTSHIAAAPKMPQPSTLPPPDEPLRAGQPKPGVPLAVVMGNTSTGEVVIAMLGDDPRREARDAAAQHGGDGWQVIYTARRPFAFVTFACVVEGEGDARTFHFFSGDDTDFKTARAEAWKRAAGKAAETEAPIVECGKTLNIPGRAKARETGIVDYAKGVVRQLIACDSTLPAISAKALREEEGLPPDQQPLHQLLATPGPNGRSRCVDSHRHTSVGVRN
jgi:hypothetical protein